MTIINDGDNVSININNQLPYGFTGNSSVDIITPEGYKLSFIGIENMHSDNNLTAIYGITWYKVSENRYCFIANSAYQQNLIISTRYVFVKK